MYASYIFFPIVSAVPGLILDVRSAHLGSLMTMQIFAGTIDSLVGPLLTMQIFAGTIDSLVGPEETISRPSELISRPG